MTTRRRKRRRKAVAIFEEFSVDAAAGAVRTRGGNVPRKPRKNEFKLRSEIVRSRTGSEQNRKTAPSLRLPKNEKYKFNVRKLSLSDREERRNRALRANAAIEKIFYDEAAAEKEESDLNVTPDKIALQKVPAEEGPEEEAISKEEQKKQAAEADEIATADEVLSEDEAEKEKPAEELTAAEEEAAADESEEAATADEISEAEITEEKISGEVKPDKEAETADETSETEPTEENASVEELTDKAAEEAEASDVTDDAAEISDDSAPTEESAAKEVPSELSEKTDPEDSDTAGEYAAENTAPTEEDKSQVKKSGIRKCRAAAAAILLIAGAYGYGIYYYGGHFLPKSMSNGIDIGNLTAADAKKKLSDEVSADYIDLIGRDKTERLSLDGTDIRLSDSSISDALKSQNNIEWFRYYLDRKASNNIQVSVSCDEDLLNEAMDSLSMLNPADVTIPQDAYTALDDETGLYVIVKEVEGNEIRRGALRKAIMNALSKGERELNLEEADVYFEPVVRSDDEELSKDLWRMSLLNSAGAVLDLGAGTASALDGQTVNELIGEDNHASEPRVREFVAALVAQYNTFSEDGIRAFTTHKGEIKQIKTDYGWELDEEATFNTLFALLERIAADTLTWEDESQLPTLDHAGYAVSASWKKTAAIHGNGTDIGENYVEIDMGEQNVYVFVDGECVLETPCVTGRMTKGRITPEGMYTIKYKQRNKTLVGYNPNGTVSYRSPVSYWMPFNRGIGLHDASWRGSFGGQIYVRSGSHGCVNLPKAAASQIYDIVYKGMPVICYY